MFVLTDILVQILVVALAFQIGRTIELVEYLKPHIARLDSLHLILHSFLRQHSSRHLKIYERNTVDSTLIKFSLSYFFKQFFGQLHIAFLPIVRHFPRKS